MTLIRRSSQIEIKDTSSEMCERIGFKVAYLANDDYQRVPNH
jgi:hypothetical protein